MSAVNQTWIKRIGWFASMMALLMFASYVDQIRLNLSGQKGSLLLPIATVVNCSAWVLYAWLREQKDWPILVCNIFGVLVAVITAITAVV